MTDGRVPPPSPAQDQPDPAGRQDPATAPPARLAGGAAVAGRALVLLEKLERAASVALVIAIFLAVCVQVVFRYVLNSPLTWTDEVARYSLIWLTFVAGTLVMARNRHITVNVLGRLLQPRSLRWLAVGALAVAAATCAWAAVLSWDTVAQWAPRRSTALRLPMSVVMAAPLVGFALMALHAAVNAARGGRAADADPEGGADTGDVLP